MAKIKVYRKDTGDIVRVPEHFMDHPVLSKPFRKIPSQKSSDEPKTPTERAGSAATNPSNRESANAGDDKKE